MKATLFFLIVSQVVSVSLGAEWTKRDEGIATYEVPADVGERLSNASRIFVFCERNAPGPWPPSAVAQHGLNAAVSFLAAKKEESLQWSGNGSEFHRDSMFIHLSRDPHAYPQMPYYIYIAVTERVQNDIAAFYVHIRFRDMKDFPDVKRILSSIKIRIPKKI